MVTANNAMIYNTYAPKKERLSQRYEILIDSLFNNFSYRFSELVSQVSRRSLPKSKDFIVVEITASRLEDNEDVDVSYVKYRFRDF